MTDEQLITKSEYDQYLAQFEAADDYTRAISYIWRCWDVGDEEQFQLGDYPWGLNVSVIDTIMDHVPEPESVIDTMNNYFFIKRADYPIQARIDDDDYVCTRLEPHIWNQELANDDVELWYCLLFHMTYLDYVEWL